jgi:hypothetical protein
MEVPTTMAFVTSIHERSRFSHLGREDLERSLAHGESQAAVSNHRRDNIGQRSITLRQIDCSDHGGGATSHRFLPSRAEALTTESAAVRCGNTVHEQILEVFVHSSCSSHPALPAQAVLESYRRTVCDPP